jgi:hypothetical protein
VEHKFKCITCCAHACTENVEHYFMALGVAMSKIASDFGIVMKGRI